MEYYSYHNVVIECEDNTNYKDIVRKMRSVVNANTFHPIIIMIEDIEKATAENYIEYLKTKVSKPAPKPSLGNIEAKFMEDYINDVYEQNDDLPF